MDELKVVTLNAWGLLYISKHLEERMEALANELAKGHYNIVALQEIWCQSHYNMIVNKVKSVLPYSHYFISGVCGSGCAVLSQYPIEDTIFHKFVHSGYFWDIFHADWYAGKGVGSIRIKHPLKDIYFCNTHLHADYVNEKFTECRTLQIYEITQFINHLTRPGDGVILCGDFNHEAEEIGIRALQQLTDLKDTYVIAKEKLSNCMTLDSVKNKYNDPIDGQKRIDYIFVNGAFECSTCDLALDQIPNSDLYFSDHFGYTVSLKFNQVVTPEQKNANDTKDMLKELSQIMKDGEKLSNEIIWKNLLLVFFLTAVFVLLPLVAGQTFPTSDTWFGKILFIIQILTISIATIYFLVVMFVNRKLDGSAFRHVSSAVDLKYNAYNGSETKKFL